MSELNTIREAIDAIATGKFVVVVDDEDRENEDRGGLTVKNYKTVFTKSPKSRSIAV